ncbi:AAA family ATPase [Microbacterium sp. F51-2R]|uniref:AAA family ATPase n=1 Tax=Microbacterium sp. F51-2R TaxID=3445777 RepID=UPI003F9F5C8D
MRGGLERWKRGVGSQGVRQALAYAFEGSCDSHLRTAAGVEALASYGAADPAAITRFTVEAGVITTDTLDAQQLRRWVDGRDPATDERRGRDLTSPDADLILDGTINTPKSYSVAAMINPDLAREFEALQDRLRDRIIKTWQSELNARRGAGGSIRESLHRIEVVELQHRRSRALDPHIHRHLWLNVKVLGKDRKWSNIDSRVAMKMQTVINAEGELAARTDPQWVSALARHGYTLKADGEIAELAHAVRPLSRRSTQIEANRAVLLAAWRGEHPGLEPSPDGLHRIDRLAWAKARPNKPGDIDEATWERLIADELVAIDDTIMRVRDEISLRSTSVDDLDLGLLAAQAVVEADARSASCGGRFSLFDIRAGATRAIAASGVVTAREDLQAVIDDVIDRALEQTVDLLEGEAERPAHIKGYMASVTAAAKFDLAARFDALTQAGDLVEDEEIADAASTVLTDGIELEDRQVEAVAAIAGTDRLVSVTGPAGAGKTTMLRVAKSGLARYGRRMIVVAPTKKGASVAGREIGASASSLHALLGDHGFRWKTDVAGAEVWTRLALGEIDPATGIAYGGPRRYPLVAGDRIVVDEAGMVDLNAAIALATIAAESGAGVAMVGDHLQARPVGHSGAMATMTRRATAVVELTAVHRFTDPEYAALTLRMREPASKNAALAVASELAGRGQVHRVSDHFQARDLMVESYFRWTAGRRRVALVTSTNEEADAINEAIQQRRVDRGELELARIAIGQGEQRLLEGDIVQTRKNDRATGVENRALWVVRRISVDGVELASVNDSIDVRVVSRDYAADHVHLAYASTVHGIQGETTDASIVGPGVDAAGLYVGMTRGRSHNEVIAIARTDAAATQQIAESMRRGIPEVSIDDSVRAARSELGRAALPPHDGNNAELVELNGWLRDAKFALLDLDSRITGTEANAHGRAGDGTAAEQLVGGRNAQVAQFESEMRRYESLLYEQRAAHRVNSGRRGRADAAAPVIAPHQSDRIGLGR